MNLLEHVAVNLDHSKLTLVKRLLYSPWRADLLLVRPHVSRPLFRLLSTAQRDVLATFGDPAGKRPRLLRSSLTAVGVRLKSSPREDRSLSFDGSQALWIDQLWAQALEDLEAAGYSTQALTATDRAAFVRLYTIAHACFFELTNLQERSRWSVESVALQWSSAGIDAHRLYWFAQYMSQQSLLSDHLQINQYAEVLNRQGMSGSLAFNASSEMLSAFTNCFSDKYLSFHLHYLRLVGKQGQGCVDVLHERVRLIVYLHVWRARLRLEAVSLEDAARLDQPLPLRMHKAGLRLAGFTDQAVKGLLDACRNWRTGDRVLEEADGGELWLGDVSLKCALQACCSDILMRLNFRDDWFAKDHIAEFTSERILDDRYRVHGTVKGKQFHADMVIEDMQSQALLFCQVRHRVESLRPHLREEIREYTSSGEIDKGLRQLKGLRDCIESDETLNQIRQLINQRSLSYDELRSRARYLLLHNCENLDFCTSEGVAMYEWNTFRSLLRRGFSLVSKDGHDQISTSALDFDLGDPKQTMDTLWAWLDSNLPAEQPIRPSTQWEMQLKSSLQFIARRSWRFGERELLSYRALELSIPLT